MREVSQRRAVRVSLLLACVCGDGCGTPATNPGVPAGAESPEPAEPAAPVVMLQAAPPPGVTGRLVFHTDREGRNRLFVLDLATHALSRLTTGRDYHDEEAAWSPDGAHVAFTTTRFDSRTWDIAVMDATGKAVRRVTTHLAFDRHAAWMPDGRSLLFTSEQDGTQAVFRAWLDTGRVARVSPPPERALMPAVSPDGRRVAYTMGTPGGLRVAVQELDSGDVRMMTREGGNAAGPRWSPDGTRLAYTRLSQGGSSIEILTLATGTLERIAVDGLPALREPAWSLDGRWIAVAGSPTIGEHEDWDLVVLQPGPPAAAFRLTGGRAHDRAPSWSPR